MSDRSLPVEIAQALIRCASVTPQDAGALSVLRGYLERAGFAAHSLSFGAPDVAPINNLYARIGTQSPCLVFAGHTDVVPPGDPVAWRFDPFAGEIADGALWGRGAVDMKGGVAAAAAAACRFLARQTAPLAGSIVFLITGDEEGPAVHGTAELLAWAQARGERFDHCILGEPTNPQALGDMMKNGRRGSLNGTLTVHGTQGHVAYPHLADNPIPRLLRLAGALTAPPLDTGSRDFDPSNLEITNLDVGNRATNVIPGEARARFNVRFNDRWTAAMLAAELQRRCAAEATDTTRFTLAFEPCNAEAFLTEPGAFTTLVADAVEAELGRRPALSTSGGTSDARFITRHCPVVEFGLVGRTMHAVDERTSLADLDALAAVYERVLETYFGAKPA